MKRCRCCGHWIGPLVLLTSTARVACPVCWAIYRAHTEVALGVGVVLGVAGVIVAILASRSNMFSHSQGVRIIFVPLFFGFFIAKLFPTMELEEPPIDRPKVRERKT